MKKAYGLLAATAAIGLFAATPAAAGAKTKDGHFCSNNTCAGKSACGGHGNAGGCAGKNTCKGKGWLDQDNKEDCEANGGKWAMAKKGKKKMKMKGEKKKKMKKEKAEK